MDSRERKKLKADPFAREVEHTFEFIGQHKSQVRNYALVAVVVLIAAGAYWIYSSRQATARAKALADAMHVYDGAVSETPTPPNLNFRTQLEKDTAVTEAYSKVASQYRGTQEGAIAQLYLAAMKVDKGELAEAEKLYQDVVDSAPEEYAAVAKKSLAEVYASSGKLDQAEKLLREMMDNPTIFISSEEAALTLGRLLAKDKPAEARKVLEPLRESRTTISRAAIDALGRIPAAASN
jgi:predicted negative regulator of RcsB-dependent stress response